MEKKVEYVLLYNQCFEEIIRQVTINCLQRGDLLNRVKLEMSYENDYYRQLYESLIAFNLREALQEKKGYYVRR